MDISLLNKIRQMAKDGMYLAQIAKELNIDVGTIRYQCVKNGIILSKGINKINGKIEILIIELINNGSHLSEIERKTGIDSSTILYWAKKNNLSILSGKTRLKISDEQALRIKELAAAGISKTKISRTLSLTKPAVQEFCRRNNIELNKGNLQIYEEGDLQKMLNLGIELTGNKLSGKYEIRCKTHLDFTKYRAATDLHQSCPKCSNCGNSKGQEELAQFISGLGFHIENRYRLGRKEIDIYINEKSVGIEYCGLYWHSEEYKDKTYHKSKLDLAESEGIRLITVFSDEWELRQNQVKNYIKSVLGISERRVYARKCTIKQLDVLTAKAFFNENHIQGKSNAKISFGLFFKDELIGAISGNTHHRGSNKEALVLNRLAFKDGVSAVGGSSKLLKSLINWAKTAEYKKIISWSDNRWSQGNVYETLGFELDEELGPDYSYIKNRERISKQSCTKKVLSKKGAKGNTEREMAENLGMRRIWDCGKKRWVLSL